MVTTRVIIKSVGDIEPAMILDKSNTINGELEAVIIVEKGTAGGKTGITIVIDVPGEKKIVAQTTASIFRALLGALDGAEYRFSKSEQREAPETIEDAINSLIEINKPNTNIISDGFHTFGELYDHRLTLYTALAKEIKNNPNRDIFIWRSTTHSDGSVWDGWFILGINTDKGRQISYHFPISRWTDCEFAMVLDKAPEWDGHTSEEVLRRIKLL